MKKLTIYQFIERAKLVHGNVYDYSQVKYINDKTNITIICKEHGVFEQTPNNHKTGKGCNKCGKIKAINFHSINNKEFITRAKKVHKDIYDYSSVKYRNSKTKVVIICKEHGIFKQVPASHLQGHGCKKCANKLLSENDNAWRYSSWQKAAEKSDNFDSYKVYKIRCWGNDEEFYKIGRTYLTVNNRLRKLPYKYEVLSVEYFDNARKCCEREQELLSNNSEIYIPNIQFGGMHECFANINNMGGGSNV